MALAHPPAADQASTTAPHAATTAMAAHGRPAATPVNAAGVTASDSAATDMISSLRRATEIVIASVAPQRRRAPAAAPSANRPPAARRRRRRGRARRPRPPRRTAREARPPRRRAPARTASRPRSRDVGRDGAAGPAGRPTGPAHGADGDPERRGGQRGLRLLSSHQCDLPLDQLAAQFTGGLLADSAASRPRSQRRRQSGRRTHCDGPIRSTQSVDLGASAPPRRPRRRPSAASVRSPGRAAGVGSC